MTRRLAVLLLNRKQPGSAVNAFQSSRFFACIFACARSTHRTVRTYCSLRVLEVLATPYWTPRISVSPLAYEAIVQVHLRPACCLLPAPMIPHIFGALVASGLPNTDIIFVIPNPSK